MRLIVFGSHGHVPKSENHEHEGCSGFSQSEIEQLIVQNGAELILRGFWATLSKELTVKMALQTPQTPNPDFPGFSTGNQILFGLGVHTQHPTHLGVETKYCQEIAVGV